jgi:hypothetical protein
VSVVDALQQCLAAEHAAVYGYGVLGGVLGGTTDEADQLRAAAGYTAHRDRRDALRNRISDLDEEPVPAEPAYAVPFTIEDAADCRRLGGHIESRTAAVYAAAVADTVDEVRRLMAVALTDCAVRADAWGAPDDVLPGIDER